MKLPRAIQMILVIFIPIILIFALALALMVLPLPKPFPPALSSARSQIVAVITGVLGIIYLIAVVIYVFAVVSQAGSAFDKLFTSRGLSSQGYMGVGKQFRGELSGRAIQVDYVPGYRMKRALLEIYVSAETKQRIAISTERPLLDCRDCSEVGIADVDLKIYSNDGQWILGFLSDTENRELLYRLLRENMSYSFRELYIQPERLWFRAHIEPGVSEQEVEGWFDSLLILSERVEAYSKL